MNIKNMALLIQESMSDGDIIHDQILFNTMIWCIGIDNNINLEEYMYEDKYHTPAGVLHRSFTFSEAPEGYEYWHEIKNRLTIKFG